MIIACEGSNLSHLKNFQLLTVGKFSLLLAVEQRVNWTNWKKEVREESKWSWWHVERSGWKLWRRYKRRKYLLCIKSLEKFKRLFKLFWWRWKIWNCDRHDCDSLIKKNFKLCNVESIYLKTINTSQVKVRKLHKTIFFFNCILLQNLIVIFRLHLKFSFEHSNHLKIWGWFIVLLSFI